MIRFHNSRAIAWLLVASLMWAACKSSPDEGTSAQMATACADAAGSGDPSCGGSGDDDPQGGVEDYDENTDDMDWTRKSPGPWDDIQTADYEGAPSLGDSLLDGGTCYVSANFNACADPDLLAKVAEKEKQLAEKRERAKAKVLAAKEAGKGLLAAADVKVSIAGKFPVVLKKGNRTQKVSGVPYDIREQIKQQFTAANADANDGWVYDEEASNGMQAQQFMTKDELDRLVDATAKGAGGLVGMQAYKVSATRYAIVQNNRVVLFEYVDSASNPYSYTVNAGEFSTFHTWPDDEARWNKFMKWLTGHRWDAYMPVAQAIIGTDPARTRDQMIEDATRRAVQDANDAKNPFNWENLYEVIKILPITGTIDAIERGDCPDAIASGLTDLATLVGFWPAKVFRIGRLKVPAYMVMLALDGGAVAIRIAYKKDGAWVEAVIVAALQARALKQAFAPLIRTQRARAALAGTALAALSLACDNAEKAIDEAVAAEDEVLKARDELDAARIELEKSLRIPCDGESSDDPGAGSGDPGAGSDTGDTTISTDVAPVDVCSDSFSGTLADAYALSGDDRVASVEPSDPEEVDAVRELASAQESLEATVLAGPIAMAAVCTAEPTPTEPMPTELMPTELTKLTQTALQFADDVPVVVGQGGGSGQPPPQQPPPQPQPAPQPQPQPAPQPAPAVCPAPAPHPSVADLVKRYDAASATVRKMQNVLKDQRATAERALIESLTLTVAIAYGVSTDQIEKLMQEHVTGVMKELEKHKIAWNSDIERDVRLTYLVLVAGWATSDRPLGTLQVKVTGKDKTDTMAKLKEYQNSYLNLRMIEMDNMMWPIRRGAVALATVIGALPQLEEWAKNCTPITPEMLAKLGLPAQGKDPFTIDPAQWAAYLTKIEEALAKYEAAVQKAAKVVLKE
jgi:hypothetical protein